MSKDESALNGKWNLACENGHLHWSPAPMSWAGFQCGAKKKNGNRCKKPLVFIRSSKDIPQRKPKVKQSRLLKIRRY